MEMRCVKICRLCAKSKFNYKHIFEEEGQSLDLLCKIQQCLQIQVCASDDLPTVVCSDCCKNLLDCSEFFKQAKNAQVVLQSLCQVECCSSSFQNEAADEYAISPGALQKDDTCAALNTTRMSCSEREALNTLSKKCTESVSGTRIQLASNYFWHCVDCSAVLENPTELKNHHETVHQQSVKYQCLQCSKIYTVYKMFSRHVRLHRNNGKFRCEECWKGFSTKQALDAHKIIHSNAQPFVCQICGRCFRHASTLHCHQRTHIPDHNVIACPHCNKMMSTQQALNHHLLTHASDRNFICEVCGKSFTRKQTLRRHALVHTGGQSVACRICYKMFKTQQQLQTHLHVHCNQRLYQCDVCGKQFRLRSTLMAHSRIHTGEMPYMCEFCDQRFRFRGVYMIHRRKHTGERPYVCAVCGWTFSNYANHAKHMKRKHCHKTQKDQPHLHMDISTTPHMSVSFCASTSEVGVMLKRNSVPQTPITSTSAAAATPTLAASQFTVVTSPIELHINQSNIIASCSDPSVNS